MMKAAMCGSVVVAIGVAGCSSKIDRSKVVGKYVANHKAGIDSLELKSDGTYVHRYKGSAGAETYRSDKWQFEDRGGRPTVIIFEFIFTCPGRDASRPVCWVVEVQQTRIRKEIRLYLDPDLDYFYAKQSP